MTDVKATVWDRSIKCPLVITAVMKLNIHLTTINCTIVILTSNISGSRAGTGITAWQLLGCAEHGLDRPPDCHGDDQGHPHVYGKDQGLLVCQAFVSYMCLGGT